MKITAKSRYALRILLDLALSEGNAPRSISQIAKSQSLSENFVSRIVIPLRHADLLATVRGVKGGLRLARFPEKISLLDIVEAIDGPLSLVRCLSRPGICPRQGRCAAENAWGAANDALAASLRRTTLADVAADQRRLSLSSGDETDYCI